MVVKSVQGRKNKGRTLQDWITKTIRDITGLDSGVTTTHEGDVQSRSMGSQGVDIVLSPYAKTIIPFDIEAKRCEKWQIDMWWEQATSNSQKGRIPIIIAKKNRKNAMVIIDAETFLKLTLK